MEERMMKRTIAMLLALVMALSMLPVTAGAAEAGQELNTLDAPRTYAALVEETESNNTMSTANTFNPDTQIVHGYVNGDYDWFKFVVTGNKQMELLAITGDMGIVSFTLFNSSGSQLKSASYDGLIEGDDWYSMEYNLTPGTYYIRVYEMMSNVRTEYAFQIYLHNRLTPPTVSLSNRASDGKVKISWNSISYASSYKVLRSTSQNGTYTTLTTTSSTSYYDTSAVAGNTYYYKVQAISGSSSYLNSGYSNIASRTCDLAKPTGLKTTRSTSTGRVKISWNAVSGADKYELYCSTNGGSSWTKLTTVTGTSVNHGSATVGTTYTYRVRAIDTGNSSANSAYSSTVTGTAVCAKPVITVSNVASTGKVKISWGKVTGASKYTLYIYDSNGNLLKSTTTTSTALNHTSAVAGKTYTYKVKAIGSVSGTNSALSASKSRTCDLAAPTLSISTTSNGKAKLSWGKVTGAVKYKVYTSTDGGNTWKLLTTVTGTGVTHNSALRGVNYRYKVMAVASNSAANSAYSNVKTFTVR